MQSNKYKPTNKQTNKYKRKHQRKQKTSNRQHAETAETKHRHTIKKCKQKNSVLNHSKKTKDQSRKIKQEVQATQIL